MSKVVAHNKPAGIYRLQHHCYNNSCCGFYETTINKIRPAAAALSHYHQQPNHSRRLSIIGPANIMCIYVYMSWCWVGARLRNTYICWLILCSEKTI